MIGILKWLWSFRHAPRWEPVPIRGTTTWGVRWSRPHCRYGFRWIGCCLRDRESANEVTNFFTKNHFWPGGQWETCYVEHES